ncbi:hypothetical protein GF345_05345 [Candidatus Woesearchaeota archaeon]|nr:hypothetical protein [Candidatus Woesearchaeota archaeon]
MDTKKIILVNITIVISAILLIMIFLFFSKHHQMKECIEEANSKLYKGDYENPHIKLEFWKDIHLEEAKEIIESYGLNYNVSKNSKSRFGSEYQLKVPIPKGSEAEWVCRFRADDAVRSADIHRIGDFNPFEPIGPGPKALSFPTQRIHVAANKSKAVKFEIRNIEESEMTLCVLMEYLKKKAPKGECDSFLEPTSSPYNDYCGGFYWDSGIHSLTPGDTKIMGLKYYAPPERNQTYLYRLTVLNAEDNKECPDTYDPDNRTSIYAQKSFFVQVR